MSDGGSKDKSAQAESTDSAAVEAAKPADPWTQDPATPQWIDADDDSLVEALRQQHGGAILSARTYADELTFEVELGAVREVAASLKDKHGFEMVVDACGAHYPEREGSEFETVYHVYNVDLNRRIRFKVRSAEGEEVPSLSSVWKGLNWLEREAYDMYGIRYAGHPDLTRILLWEGFNGYPLRKEFPVEGVDTGAAHYVEHYDDKAGPIAGTGTGWKVPQPEEETASEGASDDT